MFLAAILFLPGQNIFFEALLPILDAYEATLKEKDIEQQSLIKAKQQQLERLRYQVKFAEAQFNKVDPENRLFAAELEKRWEQALRDLNQAEKAVQEKYFLEISDELLKVLENNYQLFGISHLSLNKKIFYVALLIK